MVTMGTDSALRKEFEFYLKNRSALLQKYERKYIVVKGEEVIGVYDSRFEAYEQTQKLHKLGTFLIQLVSKEEESYTQTFHSRVVI